MVSRLQLAATVALLASVVTPSAFADGEDPTTPAPAELAAVRVDEQLGAQVPLGLRFRDQDGRAITLGDLVRGDLPVVLTFNYSSCPMLCSMQLNGLVDVLPELKLAAGRQFRIVTVIIEPNEELERAQDTRKAYLDKLGEHDTMTRAAAASTDDGGGWTFALAAEPGESGAIKALADAVGVRFHYVADRAEWAHPAALVFLSPSGVVTRYMHGFQYTADDLRTSIMRAGLAEPSASVGFLQRCFHWDPTANSKAKFGRQLMMVGAGVFAAVLLIAVGLAHYLRRTRTEGVPRS
jgi:protein SCO1/2